MERGKRRFFSFPFPSSPARFLFRSLQPSLWYKEASAEERVSKLTTSSNLSDSWLVINMMWMMTPPIVDQTDRCSDQSQKRIRAKYTTRHFLYSLVVCVKSPHLRVSRSFGFWHKQLVHIAPYAAVNYIYLILSRGHFEDNHYGNEAMFIRNKVNILFEMHVLKFEINWLHCTSEEPIIVLMKIMRTIKTSPWTKILWQSRCLLSACLKQSKKLTKIIQNTNFPDVNFFAKV